MLGNSILIVISIALLVVAVANILVTVKWKETRTLLTGLAVLTMFALLAALAAKGMGQETSIIIAQIAVVVGVIIGASVSGGIGLAIVGGALVGVGFLAHRIAEMALFVNLETIIRGIIVGILWGVSVGLLAGILGRITKAVGQAIGIFHTWFYYTLLVAGGIFSVVVSIRNMSDMSTALGIFSALLLETWPLVCMLLIIAINSIWNFIFSGFKSLDKAQEYLITRLLIRKKAESHVTYVSLGLAFLGEYILYKTTQTQEISILWIMILTIFLLLGSFIKQCILEYRVAHGLYGTCYSEVKEIVSFILEWRRQNGDSNSKPPKLVFTQEEIDQCLQVNGGEEYAG